MLSAGKIRDMLIEEQSAGYTPEQAVPVVIDRIGRNHLREALETLLLLESLNVAPKVDTQRAADERRERRRRQMARPCAVCSTTGHREMYLLEPGSYYSHCSGGWIEITEADLVCSDCGSRVPGYTRAQRRHEHKVAVNRARADRGLAPFVWFEDELMLPAERDRLKEIRAEQRELQRREREERKVREAEQDRLSPEEMLLGYVEQYARIAYGEKIWTGVEWVSISAATRQALLACADWHDHEAEIHTAEAREHRAEAKRMRELALIVPDGGTVADVSVDQLRAVA